MSDIHDEFPSNLREDHNRKDAPKAKHKEIKKVIDGDAVVQTPGALSKIKYAFAPESTKSVVEYVIMDVVIPNAQSLLLDIISQGLERKLYGEGSRAQRSSYSSRSTGHTAYNRMYKGPQQKTRGSRKESVRSNGDWLDEDLSVDNILLKDRGSAEKALYELNKIVEEYGEATINDLYELIGVTGDFVGDKYGWYDLRGARVSRTTRGMYKLILPREVELD